MKKTLTGFAVLIVAALWMTGSWVFFNSIAIGAENTPAPAPAPPQNQEQTTAPSNGMHHRKDFHHHPNFFKQLNLSEAQKKEIKAIREKAHPKMKPLIKELKAGREELVALRKTGRFDEAKVRAIAEKQGRTLAKVIVEREDILYKIRAVLTPEQRAKLDTMHETYKSKHPRHWKKSSPEEQMH
ncbi:MAG: Spy/CpxP family protein refolding chaperone [Syntrophobacteraceae bacterium]|nr:Spy/CpxP family protein refolding chaperone [Syntrophobacteraceae bacterium]